MISLEETELQCDHVLDIRDIRFMVMAPGGENPREGIIPGQRKVGIRIHKQSEFWKVIDLYRNAIIENETKIVLGNRPSSTRRRNAFGARYFQPHISLLKAGSGILSDLTMVGQSFRETVPELKFNKFIIQKKKNY